MGTADSTDLTKAGVITLKLSAAAPNLGEDIADIKGIDVIQLASGAGISYGLTAAQALTAKMGATGAVGDLTSPGQVITITASSSADLSGIKNLDSGDRIYLYEADVGADCYNYVLSKDQIKIFSGFLGVVDQTYQNTSLANVTLKADSMGDDLVTGLTPTSLAAIDQIILTTGKDYTLNAIEAAIAKIGLSGLSGQLAKAGTVTLFSPTSPTTFTGSDSNVVSFTGVDLIETKENAILKLYVPGSVTSGTSANFYSSATQLSPLTGSNSVTGTDGYVNKLGEWKFDSTSHVLTVYDGSAVQNVLLVGVSSVSVTTTGQFTIG